MSTGSLNPCCGTAEIVTAEVALPTTAEAETGETDKLKSDCTGGGGGGGTGEPPPQPERLTPSARTADFADRSRVRFTPRIDELINNKLVGFS